MNSDSSIEPLDPEESEVGAPRPTDRSTGKGPDKKADTKPSGQDGDPAAADPESPTGIADSEAPPHTEP